MKKALIVDDSTASRSTMVASLQQKGYEVLAGENGEIGLNFAQNNSDLKVIISDINMPVMDGFEMIKKIRGFNTKVPIIALSVDEEKGNEALGIGATAFIIKSANSGEEIKQFLDKYIK
ncbi:MAG: response regulator [Spirochaetales bacterium]|nr:response regulator [Spirochaetales bacterium]